MHKSRLEAFSDGVIAIIITIMVLELKAPHDSSIEAVIKLWPVFISYVLSFIYVGIYWNNHHHLFQATKMVSGGILWANLHLLFWLSLSPFVTHWMGDTYFATWPTVVYGFVFLMAGTAFYILVRMIIRTHGTHSTVAQAVGRDYKGKLSLVIYLISMLIAFTTPWLAGLGYALVALMWFIPDRRMEKAIRREADK